MQGKCPLGREERSRASLEDGKQRPRGIAPLKILEGWEESMWLQVTASPRLKGNRGNWLPLQKPWLLGEIWQKTLRKVLPPIQSGCFG